MSRGYEKRLQKEVSVKRLIMKCFVIMGYGVKTDPATGRPLDLDRTYDNIIKPAVKSIDNMECIRANEIPRSGVIDVEMYKLLLEADVVIADLSTYNCNAIYELGVRHALKPHTTIVISEKQLVNPFDLNHVVILPYEHLGTDIGCTEAKRFKKVLKDMIKSIIKEPKIDSPVYTFLSTLQPPRLATSPTPTTKGNGNDKSLRDLLNEASDAMGKSNFEEAIDKLKEALFIDKNSAYIIQKLALATYKSEKPSLHESLCKALEVLLPLNPRATTDPETLGLHGAIYKRLWEIHKEQNYLDISIHYYNRGFTIKRDYYNGINLAYLYNVRSSISSNDEKITDTTLANRVRKEVIEICLSIIDNEIDDLPEKYWIFASLEEAYLALNDNESSLKYRKLALSLNPDQWMRESTEKQLDQLRLMLNLES